MKQSTMKPSTVKPSTVKLSTVRSSTMKQSTLEQSTMTIRIFNENDRKAVIDLWESCGLVRPWNDPDKDISRKLSMQSELFFVGEVDGKVIASAMAGYDGHRGSVFYLAVSKKYQRRGYGQLMMNQIENSLTRMGCPKLNIVVRSSNKNVLSFYHSLGYATDDIVSIGKRLIQDT